MITINQLSYHIGDKKILSDISLQFNKKKTYAIIGPNGAGKSTLLKHIMGIIQPQKNTVTINNKPLDTLKAKDHAKECSFVFQENSRNFDLSVEETIAMGRYPYMDFLGNLSKNDTEVINEVIEDLHLQELRTQPVRTLSGGEAQKVFIARALAQQTPILLLDEPTSMLDVHNSIEMLNQLRHIQTKYDLTIIMVMHDLNLAFQYASDVVLLQKGHVVLQGDKRMVLESEELKSVYGHKIHLVKDNDEIYIVPKVKE